MLVDPVLDRLITQVSPFADLPGVLAGLARPPDSRTGGEPGTLCHRIDYPPAPISAHGLKSVENSP